MTSRRPALRSGALATAVLVALALIVQLARPPAAIDDSSPLPARSARQATEPALAAPASPLPEPAIDAVASLTPRIVPAPAVDALVGPHRFIAGQVLRASDGTPLLGAVVRAVPSAATPGGRTHTSGGFKIWPREATDTLEVSVDAETVKPVWPLAPQSFPVEPGSTDLDDLRLEYDSGFTLTGTVVDQDGVPVPRASVSISAPGARAGESKLYAGLVAPVPALTDAAGGYALRDLSPPPTLEAIAVLASGPGYVETTASLPVTDDHAPSRRLDLVLHLGGTLEVVARFPDGGPARQAVASVLTAQGSLLPMRARFSLAGDNPHGTVLQNGPLAPGEYTLLVELTKEDQPSSPGAFAATRIDGATVEAGKTTRLEVVLQSGARLAGRVTDAHGAPLPGVSVWLEAVEPPAGYRSADPATPAAVRFAMASASRSLAGSGPRSSTQTDAGGEFQLLGAPAGKLRVVAKSKGLMRESIELALVPGETRGRLDFVLRPGVELTGRVTLADGSPLQPCVTVLVLPADPRSDEVLAQVETGIDGDFRADGIAPGPKRLLVIAGDGSWVDASAQPGGESQTFVAHR